MSTQREFNEYIIEKIQSISQLFGTRVVRNETINDDEYNYIRPYKKTITPFTAEVSAAVFASAENSPLEYVVKYFYPNKKMYPEQIQKLYLLVQELETLREAKQIIENYKVEYQQYLGDVPGFIMENDEAGFYSRLGFANIDESVLTVEYKISYTSGGGMAQRSFTIPMTEETIVELVKLLESKLTVSAFAKEQRALMTKKLRDFIKNRDNFTCCSCGNSIRLEPNLLLEIDHIIPVAKGGCTVEENLQTLCWKCNRAKSDKIVS
ncbi:MAG: HNH endonuclease [Treponema sp.]|nr:HNH endonuclease [Treponema sp.]